MCNPQFVYKYMSFDKFVAMVETQKLYLTRIDHWDDTFEGYLLSYYLTRDGRFSFIPDNQRNIIKRIIMKSIYAQSWTYNNHESDAMWRIYSSDCKGVRIKCSFDETFKCVKGGIDSKRYSISSFAVEYSDSMSVSATSTVKNILDGISCGDLIKYALEYKRPAFKHEVEYRFCSYLIQNIKVMCDYLKNLNSRDDSLNNLLRESFVHDDDVLEYKFSLANIKEILLDPRSSQPHRNTFEAYCSNKRLTEQFDILCTQSRLYRQV